MKSIIMDRTTYEASIGPETSLKRHREIEQRVLDVIGCEEVERDDIISASGKRALDVKRALSSLMDADQVERLGAGVRGDPYRYTARVKTGPRDTKEQEMTLEKVGPDISAFFGDQSDQETTTDLSPRGRVAESVELPRTKREPPGPRNDDVPEISAR